MSRAAMETGFALKENLVIQWVYLVLKPNGSEWGTEDPISLRMGGVLLRRGKYLPQRQEGGVAIQNGHH